MLSGIRSESCQNRYGLEYFLWRITPVNILTLSHSIVITPGTATQATPRSSRRSFTTISQTGDEPGVTVQCCDHSNALYVTPILPGKPVMLTEYGADTVAGLHMEPSMVFTEEYQVWKNGDFSWFYYIPSLFVGPAYERNFQGIWSSQIRGMVYRLDL